MILVKKNQQPCVSDDIQNSVYLSAYNALINSPLNNCTLNYNNIITMVNVTLQPLDN